MKQYINKTVDGAMDTCGNRVHAVYRDSYECALSNERTHKLETQRFGILHTAQDCTAPQKTINLVNTSAGFVSENLKNLKSSPGSGTTCIFSERCLIVVAVIHQNMQKHGPSNII